MLAGELDAAITSPDNVLAYRFVADNPLRSTADLRILAAVDRGLGLSLFTAPGVKDVDSLRGVSSPSTSPPRASPSWPTSCSRGRASRRGSTARSPRSDRPPARRGAGRGAVRGDRAQRGERPSRRGGCHRLSRARELGPYVATVLASAGGTRRSRSRR
ncbi:hypothetical protein ACFQX6_05360 [Streptosporangium lutulentum]